MEVPTSSFTAALPAQFERCDSAVVVQVPRKAAVAEPPPWIAAETAAVATAGRSPETVTVWGDGCAAAGGAGVVSFDAPVAALSSLRSFEA
jgi:hypothetical protein